MKILLHMPHIKLDVPDYFYKGLLINKDEFHRYNLEMTDLGIDELFKDINGDKIISPRYSRLFCDVERFKDDNIETMSKYGEGFIYTKLYDGKIFHSHDESYIKKVSDYYDNYHNELNKVTYELLNQDDELLILDLHSYSDKMASHFFKPPFPDVCIGIEENFYDKKIVNHIISKIVEKGYSYKFNYQYKGSLVPNCIYNKTIPNKKITSIMIEVNKRIYL